VTSGQAWWTAGWLASLALAVPTPAAAQTTIGGAVDYLGYSFDEGLGADAARLLMIPIGVRIPATDALTFDLSGAWAQGRVELDGDGDVTRTAPLFTVPGFPLDVIAQPDGSPFAGTIFVADYVTGGIVVYEPADREAGAHWGSVAPSGVPRQEVSYVRLGDRFYLAGGGTEHEVYDPATDSWSQAAPLPERLDHIQGVALDGRIYYVGGLESFPEPATGVVLIYDPATDSFRRGAPMPRPRGGGGVAVHQGRIYYFCSEACQQEFSAAPERLLGKGGPAAEGQPAEAKMPAQTRR